MSLLRGQSAELQALAFLRSQGLRKLASNYRVRCGEIDLIMREGETLVFIEVRMRTSQAYGGAAASITRSKQQKIIKSALYYLQQARLYDKHPIRFDVVTFDGEPPQINWIKHAFGSG